MLSIDLFSSKFERELREGAVDDLEYRRIQLLNKELDDLMKRYGQARTDNERADIKRRYEELKAERASYFKVREAQQPQRPPAKGLLKNKDLVTPQQRVAGATPSKPGIGSAVKDVVGGIKRFVKGQPDQGPTYEDISEQDDINAFGPPQGPITDQPAAPAGPTGGLILSVLAKAWDDKLPYVDLPFNPVATMSRGKIYDTLITLKKMSAPKMQALVKDVFADRSKFLLWASQLKRYNLPVERPKSEPGQMKLFQEADGQKKNPKSREELETPQNLAVQRYLQTVRRKHPAASSDLEAIAKDDMEQKTQTDQTIKDLKAVNRRQDAALKKAMSLDRQQGNEIDDIEKQLGQLSDKLQIIKTAKPVDGAEKSADKTARPSAQPVSGQATKVARRDRPTDADAAKSAGTEPSGPDQLAAQNQKITAQLQALQKELDLKQNAGATDQQVKTLQQKIDTLSTQLQTSVDRLATQGQPKTKTGQIDLFPSIPDVKSAGGEQRKKTRRKEPEDLALAKQILGRFKTQPADVAVQEHGGGIGPRQRWQDLMPESEMSNIDIMRQDLKRMSDLQFLRAHGMSKVAFKTQYRTLLQPAPQQDMPVKDMDETFAMPGMTIPRKSVIQGYIVFFNPVTKTVSVTRGGDSEEAAIEQARIGTVNMKTFRNAADKLIDRIENIAEGWSDDPLKPTKFQIEINGRPFGRPLEHTQAQKAKQTVLSKARQQGRKEPTVTLRPLTDESAKSKTAAAALAACMAAGGTLQGCATNPSVQGTIGTVRDVGTAVKTAKDMTRAGVQDELNQELRNFIRAQGGDPGSQNLSLLYKLQKRLQGKKEPPQAVNEVKDTPAVERAIIERIMVTDRPFMIKYGPAKVMTAAEDVAYNVGDVGAFGKEDVDGWVHQVKQILGATP